MEDFVGKVYDLYDLIVSDIMMPGVDGFGFARTVRETSLDLPIVFIIIRDESAPRCRNMTYGTGKGVPA